MIFTLFLVLFGAFIFTISYSFILTSTHTKIVVTGYLGMIVGFTLATLGVYNFIITSAYKRNRLGEKPRKITVERKRKKVLILIDIGIIFSLVGVVLLALVGFGIIGRPEDLFTYSNMYANIGTLLLGFGVILSGIGIVIEIFLALAFKKKSSHQNKF